MAVQAKPGIMDGALSAHLAAAKRFKAENEADVRKMVKEFALLEMAYNPEEDQRKIYDKKAADFRKEGNELFLKRDYQQARLLYTKSIAAAITGKLAAVAFANRSAALFYMNKYEECLEDIEHAISSKHYPSKLMYKLHLRQARCLKFLQRNFDVALASAIEDVKNNNKEEREKLEKYINEDINKTVPEYVVKIPKPNKWMELPELTYGANDEVPAFSSAAALRHSDELGRHVVATRNIETGDILAIDKCLVASLGPEQQWDYCSFCFNFSLTLIPCQTCGYVMYCGTECRETDWQGCHQSSCYFIRYLADSEHDQHLFFGPNQDGEMTPGRISVVGPVANCLQRMVVGLYGLQNLREVAVKNKVVEELNCDDPRTRGFRNGKFLPSLESFLSLEDNFSKLTPEEEDKYYRAAFATAAMYHLPENEIVPMAALFMKMMLILIFNYKITQVFHANFEIKHVPVIENGVAIYLASSMINHSCDPNMYRVTYGTTAVYRAMRPVRKGEQLTECYHVSIMNNEYDERQINCQEISKFTCKCEACKGKWPLMADMGIRWSIQFMGEAGIDLKDLILKSRILYLVMHGVAADAVVLPQLQRLLAIVHEKDRQQNQWYFLLQKTIKNHYKALGNCLFFGNAREILLGEEPLDFMDADLKLMVENEKKRSEQRTKPDNP